MIRISQIKLKLKTKSKPGLKDICIRKVRCRGEIKPKFFLNSRIFIEDKVQDY